jgi:hypothetical protein
MALNQALDSEIKHIQSGRLGVISVANVPLRIDSVSVAHLLQKRARTTIGVELVNACLWLLLSSMN